jgi:hypothetical protein
VLIDTLVTVLTAAGVFGDAEPPAETAPAAV